MGPRPVPKGFRGPCDDGGPRYRLNHKPVISVTEVLSGPVAQAAGMADDFTHVDEVMLGEASERGQALHRAAADLFGSLNGCQADDPELTSDFWIGATPRDLVASDVTMGAITLARYVFLELESGTALPVCRGPRPDLTFYPEVCVYSPEFGFGGTVDLIVERADGARWLFDFKRRRKLSLETVRWQTAAYAQAAYGTSPDLPAQLVRRVALYARPSERKTAALGEWDVKVSRWDSPGHWSRDFTDFIAVLRLERHRANGGGHHR